MDISEKNFEAAIESVLVRLDAAKLPGGASPVLRHAPGRRANRFPCQPKVAVIASGAAPDDNGLHIERTSNHSE